MRGEDEREELQLTFDMFGSTVKTFTNDQAIDQTYVSILGVALFDVLRGRRAIRSFREVSFPLTSHNL